MPREMTPLPPDGELVVEEASSRDVCGPGWDNEGSGVHVEDLCPRRHFQTSHPMIQLPFPPEHVTPGQGCVVTCQRD